MSENVARFIENRGAKNLYCENKEANVFICSEEKYPYKIAGAN